MEKLHNVLPDVEYKITDINEENNTCIVRVRLQEELDAIEWLRSFQQCSKTQWIVRQKTSSNVVDVEKHCFQQRLFLS